MLLPIEETITDLTDSDKPLVNSRQIDLSNLNPEELRVLIRRGKTHSLSALKPWRIV